MIGNDLMNEGYDGTHCSPDCWCKKKKNMNLNLEIFLNKKRNW